MYIPHFLYSFFSGHVHCFHGLALVNNIAVNIRAQISLGHSDFISL